MTTITIDRAVVEQALEALYGIYIAPEHDYYINAWWPACRDAIPALRAALAQQTLNAPEECEHKADGWYAVQRVAGVTRVWPMTEAQALRAALAQQDEPVTRYSVDQPLNYMTRCADGTEFINTVVMPAHAVSWAYAAPPQQAEPVEPVPAAVVATQSDVWRGYNGQWQAPGGPIKMVWVLLRDLPTGTLLYTAPPQRKPLTEEDIDKIFKHLCNTVGASYKTMTRAVERAHGIKE